MITLLPLITQLITRVSLIMQLITQVSLTIVLLLALKLAIKLYKHYQTRYPHNLFLKPVSSKSPNKNTPHIYSKKIEFDKDIDTIIIGTGISGLMSGVLLAKAGKKILLLEQHDKSGGCCHEFEEKGYKFSSGVHYIGNVHENSTNKLILDYATDSKLKFQKMDPIYDEAIINNKVYNIRAGKEEFKTELLKHFPREEDGIDKYFQLVEDVKNEAMHYIYLKMLPRFVVPVAKLFLARKYQTYIDRDVTSVLKELTDNKDLIAVLSYLYGDYGIVPKNAPFTLHAQVANHYLKGGYYPIGGSERIVKLLQTTIEANGGVVLTRAKVKNVMVKKGQAIGVQMENNQRIYSKSVISSAGYKNTCDLLKPKIAIKYGFDKMVKSSIDLKPSVQHCTVFIGINKGLKLPARQYWVFRSNNLDKDYENYINSDTYTNKVPCYFISFSSQKDPEWQEKHPNKSVCEILFSGKYEWFSRWDEQRVKQRNNEYKSLKQQMKDDAIRVLLNKFPDLKDYIDYVDVGTPLSTKYYLNSHQGSSYGICHDANREKALWLRPDTDIQNLYLTGQDVVSVGFTGAMMSAFLTISYVLNRNILTDLKKYSEFNN